MPSRRPIHLAQGAHAYGNGARGLEIMRRSRRSRLKSAKAGICLLKRLRIAMEQSQDEPALHVEYIGYVPRSGALFEREHQVGVRYPPIDLA